MFLPFDELGYNVTRLLDILMVGVMDVMVDENKICHFFFF